MPHSFICKGVAVLSILYCITQCHVACEEPETRGGDGDQDDVNSFLPAEKRQHNIMRFGKRPSAPGHNLIRFGKRLERMNPQHSYLFFGKRADETRNNLPDLIRYLQKSQDSSWKRGHTIMRFGKRADNHHFIRFGKRDGVYPYDGIMGFDRIIEGDDDPQAQDDAEDMKRNGHSMMYFGKRGGHNMLYFGKRGGHNMLYFGKRQSSEMEYPELEDTFSENKRGPHSIIRFGKRELVPDENVLSSEEDKRAHSMIHFGKRLNDDDLLSENDDEKKAHSMIHFGKRVPAIAEDTATQSEPKSEALESDKRGTHSMIHFGKRNGEEGADENLSEWIHQSGPLGMNFKRYHSLLRFGKRFMDSASSRGGGHSMIHFGKREDGKRAHSMIHFGKRSIQEGLHESTEEDSEEKQEHASGTEKHGKRLKREVNADETPIMSLVNYVPELSEIARQMYDTNDNHFGGPYVFSDNGLSEDKGYPPEYQVEEVPLFFTRQVRSDWRGMENEFQTPDKRENSKNVFLRFGKR